MDALRRNPTACSPPRPALAELTPELGECSTPNTSFVLAGCIADKVPYGVEPAAGARPEHHSRAFHDDQRRDDAPSAHVTKRSCSRRSGSSTPYEKHLLPGQSFSERLARGYVRRPLAPDDFDARGELTDITGWDDVNGCERRPELDVARYRTLSPRRLRRTGCVPRRHARGKITPPLDLLQRQNELGVGSGGATHEARVHRRRHRWLRGSVTPSSHARTRTPRSSGPGRPALLHSPDAEWAPNAPELDRAWSMARSVHE
jgi:hypothetical protein